MRSRSRPSPAKLNLTLAVGPRRPDGYHEIESLVVCVDLCDTVTVVPRDTRELTLECDDPTIPADARNLALRAAAVLSQAVSGAALGAHIRLEKRIPAGAGLGGGSSNAATTLTLLNEAWDLGRSPTQLAEIAGQIGSDVPLFLGPPACFVRGRGERIEPLPRPILGWAALILPGIPCHTAAVYAEFDRGDPPAPPAISPQSFLDRTASAAALMPLFFNHLEAPAFRLHPSLRALHRIAEQLARGPVRMTGSGSAMFRLFDDEASARDFAKRAAETLPCPVEVCRLAVR
jgi:4-diphosphocytidyl-2-C-methyl-D-erythritol kinase